MRILVTGSAGFIGRHLVRRLLAAGHQVVGLDKMPDPEAPAGLLQITGDVTSATDCSRATRGCDVVFHLAAKVGDQGAAADYMRINAGGTDTLAQTALQEGLSRFVLMSSVAVHHYGRGYVDADETTRADGTMNAYAMSKLAAEQIVTHLSPRLAWTIVRPAVFPFGPGDFTGFVPLARALERGLVPLVAGGGALLSTAYVENLVEGLLALLQPEAENQVFVIGDHGAVSWKHLLTKIASAMGASPPRISLPFGPLRVLARAADRLAALSGHRIEVPLTEYRVLLAGKNCHFVSTKAGKLLGYRPRVDLDEAIARTLAWYRSQ